MKILRKSVLAAALLCSSYGSLAQPQQEITVYVGGQYWGTLTQEQLDRALADGAAEALNTIGANFSYAAVLAAEIFRLFQAGKIVYIDYRDKKKSISEIAQSAAAAESVYLILSPFIQEFLKAYLVSKWGMSDNAAKYLAAASVGATVFGWGAWMAPFYEKSLTREIIRSGGNATGTPRRKLLEIDESEDILPKFEKYAKERYYALNGSETRMPSGTRYTRWQTGGLTKYKRPGKNNLSYAYWEATWTTVRFADGNYAPTIGYNLCYDLVPKDICVYKAF